jgi:hypothetical protein
MYLPRDGIYVRPVQVVDWLCYMRVSQTSKQEYTRGYVVALSTGRGCSLLERVVSEHDFICYGKASKCEVSLKTLPVLTPKSPCNKSIHEANFPDQRAIYPGAKLYDLSGCVYWAVYLRIRYLPLDVTPDREHPGIFSGKIWVYMFTHVSG